MSMPPGLLASTARRSTTFGSATALAYYGGGAFGTPVAAVCAAALAA